MSDPTPAATKEKILIIESDAQFGERLAMALQATGYQPIVAVDGLRGLKDIYDNLPRLVIIDVAMPGIDGYEILEKKQSEPLLAKIPVFLLSLEGVVINMQRIPTNSVAEFLMMLYPNTDEIVRKVDAFLGHGTSEARASEAKPLSPDSKRILWVEDDKLIGSILSKKLTSSGFILFLAKNGQEALAHLKDTIPDGIVIDLLMPGMGGFEILQEIKKDERLAKVPVMILSNLSKQSDIERSKVLGAQKFIVKASVSLDQIIAEVRDLCK